MVVGTVFTVLACLFPQSAQARRFGFSGSPNGTIRADECCIIDSSIQDSSPNDDNVGIFKGAFEKFSFTIQERAIDFFYSQPPLLLGDIRSSLITDNDLIQDLIGAAINPDVSNPTAALFVNGGVQYEATFSNSLITFTFFAPFVDSHSSTRSALINDLSSLEQFNFRGIPAFIRNIINPLTGSFYEQIGFGAPGGFGSTPVALGFRVIDDTPPLTTKVPEPISPASLLGIGAISTISLLRRRNMKIKLANSEFTLSK
ncbi:hypothetical protein CAL7716_104150 (plasmid) [Calothrix sp. PCC 7716]|nr:hypothetical protein CAL7716_104150 [Calothrix sp. PCC 7716]